MPITMLTTSCAHTSSRTAPVATALDRSRPTPASSSSMRVAQRDLISIPAEPNASKRSCFFAASDPNNWRKANSARTGSAAAAAARASATRSSTLVRTIASKSASLLGKWR